jgi:predicted peroxiredoxin
MRFFYFQTQTCVAQQPGRSKSSQHAKRCEAAFVISQTNKVRNAKQKIFIRADPVGVVWKIR